MVEEQILQNEITAGTSEPHPVTTTCIEPQINQAFHLNTHTEMNVEAEFWSHADIDMDVGTLGRSPEELRARLEECLDSQLKQWGVWSDVGNEEGAEQEPGEDYLMNEDIVEIEDIFVNLRMLPKKNHFKVT